MRQWLRMSRKVAAVELAEFVEDKYTWAVRLHMMVRDGVHLHFSTSADST